MSVRLHEEPLLETLGVLNSMLRALTPLLSDPSTGWLCPRCEGDGGQGGDQREEQRVSPTWGCAVEHGDTPRQGWVLTRGGQASPRTYSRLLDGDGIRLGGFPGLC